MNIQERTEFVGDNMPDGGALAARTIIARIANLFPSDARFLVGGIDGDLVITIGWHLHDDPERPNKPSRKINLRLDESALDEYLAGESQLTAAVDAVAEFVAVKLQTFDPNHDVPAHSTPPAETWRAS